MYFSSFLFSNEDVSYSRGSKASKIISQVSSGDTIERVNRANPAEWLAPPSKGDTKLIVSMRGNKTIERGHYRSSFGYRERVKV